MSHPGLVHVLALATFALCGSAQVTSAATIYVASDAGGGNDGSSWADAYVDLQSALGAAVAGDEIWVRAGVYKPTTGTDRNATFSVVSGTALYGGFAGTESDRAERNWEVNETTLSGEIGLVSPQGCQADQDNSFHVVTSVQAAGGTALDGFVVTGGVGGSGGGMLILGGSPTIANSTFRSNAACGASGGGIYARDGATPTLSGVVFEDNHAGYLGGGLGIGDGTATLIDVRFVDNYASVTGGGLGLDPAKVNVANLTRVTFIHNGTNGVGGGMRGTGQLADVLFDRNEAGDGGGGMFGSGALARVTFTANQAYGVGAAGGGLELTGESRLTHVVFQANAATYGGAMYVYDAAPVLVNAVFVGNRARFGAGMYNGAQPGPDPGDLGPGPSLINVTFSANEAWSQDGTGGALYNRRLSPTLVNCVLWDDLAPVSAQPEIANLACTPSISNSLIAGCGASGAGWNTGFGADGGYNLDIDPQFVDAVSGDLHLTVESPAINAGSTSALPPEVTTDLDGNPRVFGPAVDMGAYELQVPVTTFGPGARLAAHLAGGAVTVRWHIDDAALLGRLELLRGIDDGPQQRLVVWEGAEIAGDGSWTDTQSGSGRSVQYRLVGELRGIRVELARTVIQLSREPSARSRLVAAVPNPFNPSTRLEYELARAGRVRLRIFDVGGRLVREVDVGHRPAGLSSIPWDGRDSRGRTLGSGVYVVRLEAGNGTSHLRVTMTK
jgi:hypothetical protein